MSSFEKPKRTRKVAAPVEAVEAEAAPVAEKPKVSDADLAAARAHKMAHDLANEMGLAIVSIDGTNVIFMRNNTPASVNFANYETIEDAKMCLATMAIMRA
jgi:hypothetical protein